MRKHPPIPVIIVVILLLAGGGFWWWWSSAHPASDAWQLSGTVEADEYQISPAIAGRIAEVLVGQGDQVNAGDVVAKLDDAALKLTVTQAKQGVVAAEANVDKAKNDSKADRKVASAKLKQAKAAQELAELQLSYATITAPIAGQVSTVLSNVGENAAPARSMLTLLGGKQYVRVYVPENQVGALKIGQSAKITTDSSNGTFDATISFIASQAEFTPITVQTQEQRVKLVYEVRLDLAASNGVLKPGMPVDANF